MADTDTITAEIARAAIANAERLMAENAALRIERDALRARVAELEEERERDHAEINIKADAIERMINQSAADYARIEELTKAGWRVEEAFPVREDSAQMAAMDSLLAALSREGGE